jgi:hypothetical protein
MTDQVDLGSTGLGAHGVGEGVERLGRQPDVLRAERRQLEVPDAVAVGPQAGDERLVGEAHAEQSVDDDDRILDGRVRGHTTTDAQDRQRRRRGDDSPEGPSKSPHVPLQRMSGVSAHPGQSYHSVMFDGGGQGVAAVAGRPGSWATSSGVNSRIQAANSSRIPSGSWK